MVRVTVTVRVLALPPYLGGLVHFARLDDGRAARAQCPVEVLAHVLGQLGA